MVTIEPNENSVLVTAISGVKEGQATITAKANDGSGVEKTFDVTIQDVPVTSITITGEESVVVGQEEKVQYTAKVEPEDATEKGVT